MKRSHTIFYTLLLASILFEGAVFLFNSIADGNHFTITAARLDPTETFDGLVFLLGFGAGLPDAVSVAGAALLMLLLFWVLAKGIYMLFRLTKKE